jgi:hypothetical protein
LTFSRTQNLKSQRTSSKQIPTQNSKTANAERTGRFGYLKFGFTGDLRFAALPPYITAK